MQGTPHIASTAHDGRSSPVPSARRAPHPGRDLAQGLPYREAAPRVTRVARRAPDEPELPIFVDRSGWRRRTLQGLALVVGFACLGYLFFVGALISGLRQPVGTRPPSTNGSAPGDPGTAKSPHGTGTPADAQARENRAGREPGESRAARGTREDRAAHGNRETQAGRGAREEREVRENPASRPRPPSGRSVPPAGGPKQ
ncbi:hypothetical protein ACFYVL_14990 [Streptomyces sp. NPDC004111]|uniref:hypothetical protein n=1 Tax=Streptomyces sp. NPDC004111 TaxID=3364690 RepID=UPI0036A42627